MSQIWQVRDMTDQGFRRYGRQEKRMRIALIIPCVNVCTGQGRHGKTFPGDKVGGGGGKSALRE